MSNASAPPPTVRIAAAGTGPATASATADVRVNIGGEPVHLQITVPTGSAPIGRMLPVFQGLGDVAVEVGERKAVRTGEAVSCREGCGACCRQVVPISPSEARALARLVTALPEPRRAEVRGRFEAALRRLRAAGVLQPLLGRDGGESASLRPLGLAYFSAGVPCPFLEDESCSIHRDRPLACREYLVTSPAAACARPAPDTVRCVPMPAYASAALRDLEHDVAPDEAAWIPLVLALEHAAAHPDDPPPRPGPAWLEDFFSRLTAQKPAREP
jgi:Fe-S-cluster containining protein